MTWRKGVGGRKHNLSKTQRKSGEKPGTKNNLRGTEARKKYAAEHFLTVDCWNEESRRGRNHLYIARPALRSIKGKPEKGVKRGSRRAEEKIEVFLEVGGTSASLEGSKWMPLFKDDACIACDKGRRCEQEACCNWGIGRSRRS